MPALRGEDERSVIHVPATARPLSWCACVGMISGFSTECVGPGAPFM
jgi:hypothetical protein